MSNVSVADKVRDSGIVSIDSPDGRFQHRLDYHESSSPRSDRSLVLDLALPLYYPGSLSSIYDRAPYGNHGTIYGAVWTRLPSGLWVLDFDGSDDYVNCGAGASMANIFDGGGTVISWINPASGGEGDNGRFICKRLTTGEGWSVRVAGEDAGKVKVGFISNFTTDGGSWLTTATELTINTRSFIALTYDSGDAGNGPTLYVNANVLTVGAGITVSVAPDGVRDDDSAVDLLIGSRDPPGTNVFDGSIGHSWLYDRILSASELAYWRLRTIGRYQ